jgi:hypothetical protein
MKISEVDDFGLSEANNGSCRLKARDDSHFVCSEVKMFPFRIMSLIGQYFMALGQKIQALFHQVLSDFSLAEGFFVSRKNFLTPPIRKQ